MNHRAVRSKENPSGGHWGEGVGGVGAGSKREAVRTTLVRDMVDAARETLVGRKEIPGQGHGGGGGRGQQGKGKPSRGTQGGAEGKTGVRCDVGRWCDDVGRHRRSTREPPIESTSVVPRQRPKSSAVTPTALGLPPRQPTTLAVAPRRAATTPGEPTSAGESAAPLPPPAPLNNWRLKRVNRVVIKSIVFENGKYLVFQTFREKTVQEL